MTRGCAFLLCGLAGVDDAAEAAALVGIVVVVVVVVVEAILVNGEGR